MKWVRIALFIAACLPTVVQGKEESTLSPGCENETAKKCLSLAIEAMGGRARLEGVKSLGLKSISHTLLMEQSYRQTPFIASYESSITTLDFTNQRMRSEVKLTWPESDEDQWESDSVVVVGREGGVRQGKDSDTPCSRADLEAARFALSLGPPRVLVTAADSADLHFEKPEMARSTLHAVLAFTWEKVPVRILLNRFNHLPDVVEATQRFHDFWFFWGDVQQRVYFDNWKLIRGVLFPTNLVEERNGVVWRSTQALKVDFNVPTEDRAFLMDAAAAKKSLASLGWNRPFRADKVATLAPWIDLLLGPWNSTIVRQTDGIVILEVPISEPYTRGIMEEAKQRYPSLPIKAVLSTSDSWPHTGGVRFAVSQHLPVYILDLNQPLLDELTKAPHTLDPDALEKLKPRKPPVWKIVSAKENIGDGPNRIELYSLRGASTERQYMAYFPEQHLLYASDTLVLNDNGTLYDPELMSEVAEAVRRENLRVETVFAMHQGPTAWNQVLTLIEKAWR